MSSARPISCVGSRRASVARDGAASCRDDRSKDGSSARICASSACAAGERLRPSSSREHRPQLGAPAQCLGLPAHPVEREHQLAPEPLPQRVGGDERFQLGDRAALLASVEPGFDELLRHRQSQLLEPQRLAPHDGQLGELAERGPSPQAEGPFERRDPLLAAGAVGEVLEADRVEVDAIDVDGVPAATGAHKRIGRERPPQARDVALQRGADRLGRFVLPQRLPEAIDAHLRAPGGHEHGQQLPALQSLDRHEHAVAPNLQRTKDVDGDARDHATILAADQHLDAPVVRWSPATSRRQADGKSAPSRWRATATEQGGTTMPFVNVKLIKGVFDADQKRAMIEKLTETMVDIEGEAMRPVTWVTIEEVESGDWGIGGKALTTQDVHDLQASGVG